ncbi:hypothetical protein BDW59DRAFT_168122 [Aspergillus cavernicola]|uniref:ATPase AAA-type core domain-containing protein n=1 Tax=Aspergillus cavernicola TaxID=176166 RepID=A0ABR4H580_9EURO
MSEQQVIALAGGSGDLGHPNLYNPLPNPYLPHLHETLLISCLKSTSCKRFIPAEWAGNIEAFPHLSRSYANARVPLSHILEQVPAVVLNLQYNKVDEVDITTLMAFPLKYADNSTRDCLWRRGKMFWDFNLQVDHIYHIQRDKAAFDNLVIDQDTKELIQALVMNQLEAERGTDIISGKGNGLIMLLHGSPGMGTIFTAEAVAEIAEKPLYRVTCGDIATKTEDVGKYLEGVLHLGKIWGCVVLLDKVDIFLEERSLSQLERNALVSVFLRALEYYEGIMIPTSNRVGTFDKVFKPRI